MATMQKTIITVEAIVNVPIHKVWKYWTRAEHITRWNNASDDWHTPWAENDIRSGGNFLWRMEAKDKSFGFDFSGVYDEVKPLEQITYTIADGRKVIINFTSMGYATKIT